MSMHGYGFVMNEGTHWGMELHWLPGISSQSWCARIHKWIYICGLSISCSRASALELTVVLIASRSRSLKINTDMNER